MQAESWQRNNRQFNKARVAVNEPVTLFKSSGTVIPSLKLPELFLLCLAARWRRPSSTETRAYDLLMRSGNVLRIEAGQQNRLPPGQVNIMNQVKTILSVFTIVLIIGGVAVSQSRQSRSRKGKVTRAAAVPAPTPAPVKRPVTINLKQGDSIQGYFLSADADIVQIEVKSQSRAFRLNEIETLRFSSREPEPSPRAENPPTALQPAPIPDAMQASARKAYTALRKLSDAAKIGLPYLQYANMLIEVRPVIDESLSTLPENGLKADIRAAMDAYVDAGQAWGQGQVTGFLPIAIEPGATLMKKYAIKPAVNPLGQEDRLILNMTLNAIWTSAAGSLNSLASALKLT